ncbi:MAG: tRNA (guanosine(37)-N1)-methyltransferase TrmD [Candidatus Marinimicrobia bacterium]|jgi:tRNA (guanine37-N1)-methyltransferase|nr:tRNA (guanosine(37)-N1)-methyltransferase TrmD [Candidatus Neomarinimicrobiota bacterium]MDP6456121.1 tRNA (guanosine(37)-N1)-methyltransferase TrmD [Candidatus Neomarinimicrobiota bacterium]MDP6592905.1 tRNA (guanosine(37)-N1)-methyltransferase TrmD [Candidatus Neomarinimicrobiota bacterium]MDP6836178.1 tRNA (guanosine(37)-N1)-methyltransferase TrmD [Candidatus Neomarinimicrobiota bacterium]MDP6966776.1 tRNA (guanosine(37)-N1)-methyltransferase TrmD [Candidatus Neomarinimicrobiota bacterium|tara:strand:+ start:390 stop:1100 length:711 start_codon:yes stop_codon:yes gene_type:complete
MNQIYILTPFPKMVEAIIGESILRRAGEKGIVAYHTVDIREYTEGKYRQIDDYPFGGGTGMVMMAEPILKAMDHVRSDYKGKGALRIIFPTPQGEILTQEKAWDLSREEALVFICGHYKGMDERIREMEVTDEISIGDYVVTGGELPAMVILDSVVRLIPEVLGDHDSATSDSFTHQLLDHPHYTRPEKVRGAKVPDVLLSGHHARIEEWRKAKREAKTKKSRPDLWKRYQEEISK